MTRVAPVWRSLWFDAGPHVFVRPDVRAQLVFANNTRVLGLFTLNFGYRF